MPPKKETKKEPAPPVEQPKVEQPPIPQHQLKGFGRFEYPHGAIYEGHWKLHNGIKMKDGNGELVLPGYGLSQIGKERYQGSWKADLMDGFGEYRYASGSVYKGEWASGKQQGKGVYQFPDGSVYQGHWTNHQLDGEGKLINSQGQVFEGIFVNGKFETRRQDQLRKEKQIKQKQKQIIFCVNDYLERFSIAFAKSDKKTFKQNLLPFFATQQQVKLYVKDPFPKYEQRIPQKWEEAFANLKVAGIVKPLRSQEQSTFLQPQRVLVPQFQGHGQVVEIKTTIGQRQIRLSLCHVMDNIWVPVFFHDNTDQKK